jgi:nucleotide-binding universal stress UspA family protein
MTTPRIVVGIDFSTHGESALKWASSHADWLGGELEVAYIWQYPWWMATPFQEGDGDEILASASRHLLKFVSNHLGKENLPRIICKPGKATEVLLDLVSDTDAPAEALVIGSGDHGVIAERLGGSTGRKLAASSPVPVIIVPDGVTHAGGPIVVGIDGSANSIEALRWGLRHARPGQEVVAIHTWMILASADIGLAAAAYDAFEDGAQASLEAAVQTVSNEGLVGETKLTTKVAQGDARITLRRQSADADVLVVGSMGHSGFAELLLGSVASSLAHRPKSVLVIVPSHER